jgi:RND superfamily putative drug exporter
MIAATVLSYFTTLGLTVWIFESLGHEGLEWKVQVFVFIVLIAVGQDYNIFFAVRFAQESSAPANPSLAAAMHRAIVHTGPVISSCGVIMAASLGSVMASDVVLLVQLGFAFALGMLIDTFVVRPLLLPAFMLLTRRSLRNASRFVTSAH